MLNYIVRRIGYGVLILLGVNLATFFLFFTVNTPDDMARLNIGGKRVNAEQIAKWKAERGYDKPLYFNDKEQGGRKLTDTIFWDRSVSLFKLVPISGYAEGLDAAKFLILPVLLALLARLGGEARLYRAMFLEEVGKDYVRTARAKGLSERVVLFRHVFKNALIPIITSAGSYLPYVFLGSLVFESFFGIPGLGAYVIDAITGQDFAIVRTMVFLGSLLYIVSYVLIDIAYTWADPRVRLS